MVSRVKYEFAKRAKELTESDGKSFLKVMSLGILASSIVGGASYYSIDEKIDISPMDNQSEYVSDLRFDIEELDDNYINFKDSTVDFSK